MNGEGHSEDLSLQEWECLEMFLLFEAGVKNDLLLKTNVKEWEYKLHGGRPEFYPQDRKALLAMVSFKNEKNRRDQNRSLKKQQLDQKLAKMRASGSGFVGEG
jgi:hypothetical protein